MAVINLVKLTPSSGSIGVSPQVEIEIILDQPIEWGAIKDQASIFLVGEGKDTFSGPFGPINFIQENMNDPLSEPAYNGIVEAKLNLDYVSTDTNMTSLGTSFLDYGTSEYYSKIVLNPIRPLESLKEYAVFIVGTMTGSTAFGVHSRSVFEPLPSVSNSGNGRILSRGPYVGLSTSTYHILITEEGVVGQAKYKWKKDLDSYSIERLTHFNYLNLRDGLSLRFSPEGSFVANDEYSVITKPRFFFSGVSFGTFVVGNEGARALTSTETNFSVPAPPFSPISGVQSGALGLKYMNPINYECDVDDNLVKVSFYFTHQIDTNSLDTNGIRIHLASPTGDPSIRAELLYTPNFVSATGNRLDVYFENT